MGDGAQSFEQTFAALEQTVQQLEAGNVPLETMLDLYEQAMRLAQQCQEMLTQAELRVRQVEAAALATDERLDLAADLDAADGVSD